MSSATERQKRKAYLLSQIQQQRLDLTASRRDWLDVTRSQPPRLAGRDPLIRSWLEHAA